MVMVMVKWKSDKVVHLAHSFTTVAIRVRRHLIFKVTELMMRIVTVFYWQTKIVTTCDDLQVCTNPGLRLLDLEKVAIRVCKKNFRKSYFISSSRSFIFFGKCGKCLPEKIQEIINLF